MNFLKSTLGSIVGGGSVGGLPYALETPPPENLPSDANDVPLVLEDDLPHFVLHAGHARSDATQLVSVFKAKENASPLAQNALTRLKTLRHPNILTFLDGTEVQNGPVIMVTERVMPLSRFLLTLREECDSDMFQQSIAWGIRSILRALQFINEDCKLVHGNINPFSIFVTKGGDWKLGGFEFISSVTMDGPSYHFTSFDQFMNSSYQAPECSRREWANIGKNPPHCVDMWSFACLLYSIFNNNSIDTRALAEGPNIPAALKTHYRKALSDSANASKRPAPSKILQSNYFSSPLITRLEFVENLAIKTTDEKAAFYKDLTNNLDTIPSHFGLYKVLPALKAVIDFGVNNTTSSNKSIKLDASASQMLPALIQLGGKLPEETFRRDVVPTVVALFSCNDRAVRAQLLQMMDRFAPYLDAKLVNSTGVFENLCGGFTDTVPALRELTVKAVLHIADKLTDANLNNRIMKHFAKLQTDAEPAIRTNTTICLGKIASKLNDKTRDKVLFPAFARALRDPFPHARLAGLRSISACDEYFSSTAVVNQILPSLSPLLLDVSPSVRDQASTTFAYFLNKAMDAAKQMTMEQQTAQREQELHKSAQEQNTSPVNAPSSNSSNGGYGSSIASWASSGVNRIVSAGDDSTTRGMHSAELNAPNTTSRLSVSDISSAPSSSIGMKLGASTALEADDLQADDEDAWGDNDLMKDLQTKSNGGYLSASTTSSKAKTSQKLSVNRPKAKGSVSTGAKVDLSADWDDGDWGGGDELDDLGLNSPPSRVESKPEMKVSSSSASLSSQSSSSSKASSSLSSRKKAMASKKENKGAMKLTSGKKAGGDDWDDWDF